MKLVVDQLSALLDEVFYESLIKHQRVSVVLVLKKDFDGLPEAARILINKMIEQGKVDFVPLSEVAMVDVGTLKLLYTGISIEGLTLLTFCQSNNHAFQSYDPTLLKAASELNVETFELLSDKAKRIRKTSW